MEQKKTADEKIDLDMLTKDLKITDPDAFNYYLKEVFSDLYSRVIENKNDPKEKQVKSNGVTKIFLINIMYFQELSVTVFFMY